MRVLIAAVAIIVSATSALAQQSSPGELNQRIATQIGNLIIQVTSQSLQIEQLQSALAASQAQTKALQDKLEPKAEAPK